MADDVYGVLPEDIAAELPGIFPAGFSATSIPTDAQMASLISTADTIVNLRIAGVQLADDASAAIAVRYIVEWTKAAAIRIAYSGRGFDVAGAAAKPYADLATQLLAALVITEPGSTWGGAQVVRSS